MYIFREDKYEMVSHPDATLVELQAELETTSGLRFSTQHLWRVVKRLGFRLEQNQGSYTQERSYV